jgi:phage gpG-like protein
MIPFKITVNSDQLMTDLQSLVNRLAKPRELTAGVAEEMHSQTMVNFSSAGRPAWTPLAPSTILARLGGSKARRKDGKLKASARRQLDRGVAILRKTTTLMKSLQISFDDEKASLHTNEPYAARTTGGTPLRKKGSNLYLLIVFRNNRSACRERATPASHPSLSLPAPFHFGKIARFFYFK